VAVFALAAGVAQAATGSVEGKATNAHGEGVDGIEVAAYTESGVRAGSTTTAGGGKYQIAALAPGEYTIAFSDPSHAYLEQTKQATVESGGSVEVNAELKRAGAIVGRVTSASTGAGLAGVSVYARQEEGEEGAFSTTSEADGDYTLAELPPGRYDVEFQSGGYLEQSTVTVLREGEEKTVNVALSEGGRIAGRVTAVGTHAPLAKIGISVSSTGGEYGSSYGFATTNANGEYTVGGLAPGSYKVEFYWNYSNAEVKEFEHAPRFIPKYITQYYSDQPSEATANPVAVATASTTSSINAEMVPSAPSNTALPIVSGTPAAGDPLTCSNGSWTGEPELKLSAGWPLTTPFSYQWLRDGAPLAGANLSSYVVQVADQGHGLACEVTATNDAGSAAARSAAVAVPVPVPVVTTSTSKLTVKLNTAKVGIACAGAPCAGSVEVLERKVVKHKHRTVVLARGSYSLAVGHSATITLRLSNAGKKKLARARHHRASAKLAISVKGGRTLEKAVQLTLATKIVRR